ncbi:MAG: prevent-host-death protein [Moorea sp. SIO3C2]|nr:prevent-host-death protein [Moorena sp. SIO3C2]
MVWRIEEAQQKLSELITATATEPQLIYDHNQLVAVVVEAKTFQEFLAWRQQCQKPSIAEAFAQLHQLCVEKNYTLEIPRRQDRPNAFGEILDDVSL